jgi:alpha-N-arabinofuranosidase
MKCKYSNPILSGFYPDPSICRVGSDFYLVTSTFAYFPGIPIFHSRDLVNWKQIGNAIDRPGQLCYDGHKISQGLFAPTIRYNNGIFYILCTLINTGGNFIITAKNPQGPYSDPVWLEGADGIDPSIFFDNDGRAWYCGTHPVPEGEAYSGNYEIYIREINLALFDKGEKKSSDKSESCFLSENLGIWRGALRDVIWPEGPHIYKIGDWYYLLHAEGGTGLDHAVCIARAKNIKGPWEGKKSNPIITHRHLGRNTEIINAGHADMTDDTDGNWWIVLLASRPFYGVCPLGRETFMVPIRWEDDWPIIATKSGLIDEQIIFDRENPIECNDWYHESACDHFSEKLPINWLTLRMPVNEKDITFSLTERKGALRLFTKAPSVRDLCHSSFAGRRIRHKNWAFSSSLEFTPKAAGESAGIILLQSEDFNFRLEVHYPSSGKVLLRLLRAAGKEDEIVSDILSPFESGKNFVLAARCINMKLSFYYGEDQYLLKCLANNIDAHILSTEYAGGFVGSLAGVYSTSYGAESSNYADVFWAEYREIL